MFSRWKIHHPALIISLLLVLISNRVSADDETAHEVTDLSYGVALYHFFQDKYFSAITDLIVAKHYRRLNTEDKNPELLLGGMYLSYGLPQKSSDIFNELLSESNNSTTDSVRDRALFHLGKNYYQAGFLHEAENTLGKIAYSLNDDLQAEKLYMLANIYIADNQLDKAMEQLDQFPTDKVWGDYIKYNTGTSLIRNQQVETGRKLLKSLSDNTSSNYELNILKDKANIALAYTALNNKDYTLANQHFEQVRLDSSQTSNALLGLGWAWYQQGMIDKALTAWLELSHQQQSSPAKHEAMVTVPYAFEKSARPEQALYEYSNAINNYKQDLKEINNIIRSIESGQFIKTLKLTSLGTESSLPASILKNIDPITNKYLSDLFTSYDFHQALKNYQELSYLFYTLNHWQNNLPALKVILEEKRLTYNKKIAGGSHKPKIQLARKLHQQREQLAARVKQLSQNDETMELVSDEERERLEMLNKASATINRLSKNEDLEEEQDRVRLLYGLMHWDITTDYAARMWTTQKNMNELNAAVMKMNTSIRSLSSTWEQAPARFSSFNQRIRDKGSKIEKLRARMHAALKQQETVISAMALATATEYASRLKMYHDRALFAKARIFDSLTLPPRPANDAANNNGADKHAVN